MPRRVTLALAVLASAAAVAPASAVAALPPARPPDAAALRAAGLRITWPVTGTAVAALAPGAALSVRVARIGSLRVRRARARVALVRVDGRGRPMRIVTRSVLTSGTLTARVPARAGARYALRLRVGERRWWSFVVAPGPGVAAPPAPAPAPAPGPPPPAAGPASCPADGTGAAELRLEPAAARPGEVVTARLTNTGTGCLDFGADFRWDALLPDGTWEPVESDHAVPAIAYTLRPGGTSTLGALVFAELLPGPHRMVKTVEGPDDELTLYAPFEVLPP